MSDTLPPLFPLVSAEWLRACRRHIVILDVRGPADFERGHIRGAKCIALNEDLAGERRPDSGARRPLPAPADFAALMRRVGVRDDSLVIVVDDARGSRAARLWWMLDSLGVSCGVLDGGIARWRGELEAGQGKPAAASARETFVARPWPTSHFVDAEEVAHPAIGSLVLDARSAARFGGQESSLDPRPGHIPGARSAPWTENVSSDGRMLPLAVLKSRFESLGLQKNTPVLLYCGSGVTACHNALALKLLGVRSRVYVGSWSEWASQPARPVQL